MCLSKTCKCSNMWDLMRNSCTCDIWDYNFRLDNAGPCMKHLVDVYSEQLRISLKSEITDIYKRQIEEIQRLKLTPTIYVSVCLCVELNELKSLGGITYFRLVFFTAKLWPRIQQLKDALTAWRGRVTGPRSSPRPLLWPLLCLDMVSFLRTSASNNVTTFLSAFRDCASVSL